jgi:hypothetical protein
MNLGFFFLLLKPKKYQVKNTKSLVTSQVFMHITCKDLKSILEDNWLGLSYLL